MPADGQNIIELGFDVDAFNEQQKVIFAGLTQVYNIAQKTNKLRISPGADNSYAQLNANTKQFTKNTADMTAALKAAEIQFKAMQSAQKDYGTNSDDNTKKDNAGTKAKKEKTAADFQAAEATRQHTAEMKNQAKQALASAGSLDAMKASLSALTAQRSALPNAGSGAEYDTLTQKIKILTQTISQEEQKVGDFRRNVGNYTGAIDTLKGSLAAVTENIQRLTAAGQQDSEMMAKLVSEQSLLTELVGQQSAGFTSLSREVMSTGKALETMAAQGLESTEAFKSLEQQFITGKRELREFRNEQTLLTSESPKISALTIAAKGLAGAYATGAGVASLFADGNEKIAKDLNQLVAIMTILQGLEEFSTFLREKSAIATAIFGTETAIVTTELGAEQVAMDEAATSTTAFSAALDLLEANPIILVLTALAGVLIYVLASMQDVNQETIDANNAQKEWVATINELNDILTKEAEIIDANTESVKKNLEAKLDLAEKEGTTAIKSLALRAQIAEVDKKIAAEKLADDLKQNGDLTALVKDRDSQYQQQQDFIAKNRAATEYLKQHPDGNSEEGFAADDHNIFTKGGIEDYIADNQKVIDSSKAVSDAEEKALKFRKDNLDNVDKAELKSQEIIAERKKLNADEARKLFLAEADVELKTTQETNGLILNNEKSTYDQRRAAIKSNTDAVIKYAAAERDAVIGGPGIAADPTKDSFDAKISWQTYNKNAGSATTSGDEATNKINQEQIKGILTAQQQNNTALLSMDSKLQEDIYKDQQKSFSERLQALGEYNANQTHLIINDAAFQISTKTLTSEELIALDTETNNKLKEQAIKNKAELNAVFVSSEKTQLDQAKADSKNQLAYQELSLYEGLKNKGEFTKKAKLIEDAQAKDSVERDANMQRDILSSQYTTDDQKIEAQKALDNDLAELDKLKLKKDEDTDALKKAKTKEQIDLTKGLTIDAINVVEDIQNGAFERQQERLEKEAATVEKNEQRKIAAINNSTLNAQQKAIAIQETEAAAAAQKAAIEKQEKATAIAKAKFDRDAGIAKVIINTAVGVTDALSQENYIGAVLIGAAGAVELAAILAEPIPSYAKGAGVNGRPLHAGGMAIFGEAGAEEIHEPGKKPYIAYEPTLASLAAGTKITPLMEGNNMNDYLLHKSYQSMNIEANKPIDEKALIDGIVEGFGNHIYKVASAIKSQKAPIIINKMDSGFGNYINSAVAN